MPSVLIVNTDRETVRAFCACLPEGETRILASRTGREAIEAVAQHRPDVVVLDTALPDGSGLRSSGRFASVTREFP